MFNRFHVVVGAALLLGCACVRAQVPAPELAIEEKPALKYLTVEVVVFTRTDAKTPVTALSTLPSYGGRQLMSADATVSETSSAEPTLYIEAPSSSYRLNNAASRLNATAGLQVLTHLAWTQSTTTQEIRVDSPATDQTVAGTVATSGNGDEALIAVDLAVGQAGEFFRLRQRQQIRLSVPVYFDHARLGAIALVSPVYETLPAVESAP